MAGNARRFQANIALFVLENHVVVARRPHAAGFTEGNIRPCHVLQFDCGVFPDMRHPGALILTQAAQKSPGLAVRALMSRKAGQRMHQGIDEPLAQGDRWPVFQHTDIDLVADDGKMSVEAGPYVNIGGKDFHSIATFKY